MYDVAIMGAGPAGSTLARMIGRELKVLLVDKRPLDLPAEDFNVSVSRKCCGGLLAPDAQKMLARQGLGLPREVMVGPQLFVVRTIDVPARRERHYQRHYINLDREKFDRWLVSLVPGEVGTRFGWWLRSHTPTDDGFEIKLSRGGKHVVERARVLVGADGAGSFVRRRAFPDAPAPRRYIVIQEWIAADKAHPHFSALFDPEISDFYMWTIPKGEALIVGAALPLGRDAAERFGRLKGHLAEFGFKLGETLRRESGLLFRPIRGRQICRGNGGIALVGEAAGWISPSSAEGFSYAFSSAMALGDALREFPSNPVAAYARRTAALRRNIILKNLKSPLMYTAWLRRLLMWSGLNSVSIRDGVGGASS